MILPRGVGRRAADRADAMIPAWCLLGRAGSLLPARVGRDGRSKAGLARGAACLIAAALASSACASANHSPSAADAARGADAAGAPDAAAPSGDAGGAAADAGGQRDAGALDAGAGHTLILREVAPRRSPVAGGGVVSIRGGGFIQGFASSATEAQRETQVFFGSVEASRFRIIDDSTLEATAPPHSAGPADVAVENPNGAAACEGCFAYFVELSFDSLSPARGPLEGGTVLELKGAAFDADLTVLVGGRAAPSVAIVDEATARAVVPPAVGPGPVDVRVFSKGGEGEIRRGFTYFERPRLDALDPAFGPLSGGTSAALRGAGLSELSSVFVGGVGAALATADGGIPTIATPPGAAPGPVDVEVAARDGSDVLPGGFVYVDPSAAALAVAAVLPSGGPAGGGNSALVVGAGLGGATAVFFGGAPAEILGAPAANALTVKVPAGAAGARVDVAVRDDSGTSASLAGGYRYALSLASVSPSSGPAAGGDVVELKGAGFAGGLEVLFGALAASEVALVDSSTLRARVPPGAGAVDVAVRDPADRFNRDALAGAYAYLEPLTIAHLSPPSGSIAGGTYVRALGRGFAPGMELLIGGTPLKDLVVMDAHTLAGRTPPGDAGAVDVSVRNGSQKDLAPGAFTYFDPTSPGGGSSGGPLDGTLNVTVLSGSGVGNAQPVQGATVMLGVDPNTLLQQRTDRRGQVTFSGPELYGAQQVTVFKDGWLTFTASHQVGQNLTVFLSPTRAISGSPVLGLAGGGAGGGQALVSGHVRGFKLPRPLAPNEVAQARVFVAPTFASMQMPAGEGRSRSGERWIVEQEGGGFTVYAGQGLRALYALFGIHDKVAQTFSPLLMGLHRGIQADPSKPVANQDIVLDMHLDQDVPATISNPLTVPGPGWPAVNEVFAWMDLGGQGLIPLARAAGDSARLILSGLPRIDGSSLLFANYASLTPGLPESICYRKQLGDVSAGVTIGPMLGMMQVVSPSRGESLQGTLRWTVESGPDPDVIQLSLTLSSGFESSTIWNAVLSGADREIALPPPVLSAIEEAGPEVELWATLTAAQLARFEYGYWSSNDLSSSNWISWTRTSARVAP
jgi:hypothetical protein